SSPFHWRNSTPTSRSASSLSSRSSGSTLPLTANPAHPAISPTTETQHELHPKPGRIKCLYRGPSCPFVLVFPLQHSPFCSFCSLGPSSSPHRIPSSKPPAGRS